MTVFYTVSGIPAAQTRASSSQMRAEFVLVQTGFASVNTDITANLAANVASIATKGAITGQAWTGAHDFSGASSFKVPTPVSATDAVTKSYADNLALSSVLPAQALGFVKSTGSVASFGTTHTGYAQNEVKGTDIASAATINLTTATGNFVHVTGTTTITAITIPVGAERTVVFDGALTLTHSAALLLPAAANIITAANDRMIVRGDTAGAVVVSYTKADGTAVRSGLVLLATLTPTAAANVDFLTTFSSTYDNYLIIGDGLLPATDTVLTMRVANAGAADTASNYGSAPISSASTTTATSAAVSGTVLAAGKGSSFVMHIANANDAVGGKIIQARATSQVAATPSWGTSDALFFYFAAAAISGVRFYWASGANFVAGGKIRVYGYSNT